MTFDPSQHGGRTQAQVDANYRIASWSLILLATTLFWGFIAYIIEQLLDLL